MSTDHKRAIDQFAVLEGTDVNRSLMRKIEDFVLTADAETLVALEKMIQARRSQLKK